MTTETGSDEKWKEPLGQFITALVLFTHALVFFQLVVCSKNMVVAFNVPTKNIGIYVSKLSGMRSLLMSVGGATEYCIYQIGKLADKENVKEIRKYASITSITCLTITRFIFLIFLYYPETVSFRNYIVLVIGAFFVGSFQISAFSIASHVSALSWLSVYLSGIFAFIIQALMDICWSKRPSLTFKIQSWIALILSIISIGSWVYNLFFLSKEKEQKPAEVKECKQKDRSLQLSLTLLLSKDLKSIILLLINQLEILCCDCKCLKTSESIRLLITDLSLITCPEEIKDEILVTIDLVRIGLSRLNSCDEVELIRLRVLALVLRNKQATCTSTETQIRVTTTVSIGPCQGAKEEAAAQTNSNSPPSIFYSISPFLMFGSGSLVKDFIFPGVIPYGLLERDKCHLINLIVIIFLSIGPITIYAMDLSIPQFKTNHMYYHGFWGCMIPQIVIFIISLCAIHTKKGCTHQIRSSRWRVFLMTMILLTCYGFLETVNIVGVPYIARKTFPDLIAINNMFGKFVRYFVYKLSVGYNKTRINSGFVLPKFEPPEPIPDTFWFWFSGAFSNGWKDIKGDFKMGIKQYLEVSQTVSKKSPLETLRYCDLLM